MKDTDFTPGPLTIVEMELGDDIQYYELQDEDGCLVADSMVWPDAVLFRAASDVLIAAENVLTIFDLSRSQHNRLEHAALDALRKSTAKARGESS